MPLKALTYSENRPIGDVLAEVERERNTGLEALERKVPFEIFIQTIAEHFSSGTIFGGKVQVNKPPLPDHLNIYFLASDPDDIAPRFRENCSYIGYQNAIVCDGRFVAAYLKHLSGITVMYDTLVSEFGAGPISGFSASLNKNLNVIRQYLQQNFLIWLLGHEIGHAVLHRTYVVSRSALHFNLQYDELEKAADAFVVTRASSDPAIGAHFRVMLGEFIQQEFRRSFAAQHEAIPKPGSPQDRQLVTSSTITVGYSRYNVPLILRALRMLLSIYAVRPALAESAYYTAIDGKIVLVDSLAPGRYYDFVGKHVVIQEPRLQRRDWKWLAGALAGIAAIILLIVWRSEPQHF